MFINLVNTDIPFEEYQITQDKIDALRFRLLLSEGYLNAYELDDIDEEFDCYTIFLLSSGGKLLFLLVGNAKAVEEGYPVLRIIEMSNDSSRKLEDEEVVDFISSAYDQNQDKPITCGFVSLDNEVDRIIIQKLEDELEYIIKARRRTPKEEVKEESAVLRHYEEYDKPAKRNVDYELSSTEQEEMERLKHIFLKKIYNFDYLPNSDQ